MFDPMFPFPFFKFGFFFADGADGGGGGDSKGGNTPGDSGAAAGEAISKAEYEKLMGEHTKLKQELEDTRMEIMTPEYIEFLNASKGEKKETPKSETGSEDLSKLTPAQLIERAKELAKAELKKDMENLKSEFESTTKAQTQKEVAAFARKHEDFELLRPTMYGLSLDPKNKDLTLEELYQKSKEHIARIHTPASSEEKKRQVKLSGEKPGTGSSSFQKDKKLTSQEAAEEAWNEVIGEGSLPPAI